MIYITGDCHGDFHKFNKESFPEQTDMTKDDYVIVCGDFGGVWDYPTESKHETWWLNWLESLPFSLLFIDGNHENFDRLNGYPKKEWNGGYIHEIRPHVLHLIRGYIFNINGFTFFTFGGARSHDIDGGILDSNDKDFDEKKGHLNQKGISYRVNHRTWWEEEMPNDDEKRRGKVTLCQANHKVDFIISHDCPSSTLALYGHGMYKSDELNAYFESIRSTTEFKKWFFGHYHNNQNITCQEIMIYEQIIRIV